MRNTPSFIIVVLAVCGLAVVSQLYLPVPLLVEMAERYDTSVSAAGLVLTVFGIAYATGFLVFGPLSDRLGRKVVMVSGLGFLALASLLVALAPTFEMVVGARILQGFVAAALPPVALAYLPETLPEKAQAFGIACMSTAFMLAGLLGQLYGSALGSLSAAVLPLAIAYATGAVIVTQLPGRRIEGDKDLKSIFGVYLGLPDLLSNRALLRTYAGTFVLLFSFVAFYTTLELFGDGIIRSAGMDLTAVRAVALPAMLLPLIMVRFVRSYGPQALVCTGLSVGATGLIVAGTAPGTVWLLVLASVVFVAGISMTVPGLIRLVGSLAPERRGMALAIYAFVLFVGASLGPQVPILLEPLGFGGVCLVLGTVLAATAIVNLAGIRTSESGSAAGERRQQ